MSNTAPNVGSTGNISEFHFGVPNEDASLFLTILCEDWLY